MNNLVTGEAGASVSGMEQVSLVMALSYLSPMASRRGFCGGSKGTLLRGRHP